MNSNIKIGFIGFGNMASAICDGILLNNALDRKNIYACANRYEKLLLNTEKRGINACKSPEEVIEKSNLIFVAVKPYLVKEVLLPVREKLVGKTLVSIAAGCDFNFYEDFLLEGTNHISTIPNTPVAVGEGIFVCEEIHSLNEEQLNNFTDIIEKIALIEFIDSKHLSVAGTVAGCGPAFAAMFIEALGDAGVKYGLKRDTAYNLASKMVLGTAKLQQKKGEHPAIMKDKVCSPGGTTIKGVTALEHNGFRGAIISAIEAIED